jgi:hypothetical protein
MMRLTMLLACAAFACLAFRGAAYAGECGGAVLTEYETRTVIASLPDEHLGVTMHLVPLSDYLNYICHCNDYPYDECNEAIMVRSEPPPYNQRCYDNGCWWEWDSGWECVWLETCTPETWYENCFRDPW